MGIISIDPKLQKSEEIAEFFSFMIDEERNINPKFSLPKILAGKIRPGLDSDITTAAIISRFPEIGIPTGPLETGQPNVMESLIRIIIEEVYDAIKYEMRIDAAVDSGMIVTSAGVNAAGPVASTGSNPLPHTATAIAV